MKIAAITDDGITISKHFGRAAYYLVVSVENGEIKGSELREKLGHSQFAGQPHAEDAHGPGHGMDSASHNRHLQMSEAISDCEVLICGGMGMGAYQSILQRGIKPVMTDLDDISEAVTAYLEGRLADRTDLLH